jgi:hypothetical protein
MIVKIIVLVINERHLLEDRFHQTKKLVPHLRVIFIKMVCECLDPSFINLIALLLPLFPFHGIQGTPEKAFIEHRSE